MKFSTNDDWIVFPRECREMASALTAVSVEQCKRIIEEDEDEVEAVRFAAMPNPPDFDAAARDLHDLAKRYADYCELAARYGGFRVR